MVCSHPSQHQAPADGPCLCFWKTQAPSSLRALHIHTVLPWNAFYPTHPPHWTNSFLSSDLNLKFSSTGKATLSSWSRLVSSKHVHILWNTQDCFLHRTQYNFYCVIISPNNCLNVSSLKTESSMRLKNWRLFQVHHQSSGWCGVS